MRSHERSRNRNRGGFTLTELMITCALIGTIASIAIPNFLTYQARSRRSEAVTNIAGIARAYKAYHAEQGRFPDMITVSGESSLPAPGPGQPNTQQMPWDNPTEAFFDVVGWRPDGNVYYSYAVNSNNSCSGGCDDQTCFTITGHGNVDSSNGLGAVMFVHPLRDAAGSVVGECPEVIRGLTTPLRPGTMTLVYDEPAVNYGVDLY